VLGVLSDGAVAAAEESLALARQLAVPSLVARSTADLGMCRLMCETDMATTAAVLEEAIGLLGDSQPETVAVARLSLAMATLYRGDAERASVLCAQSLEQCRAVGDKALLGVTLIGAAMIALSRGDPAAAAGHLRDGLEAVRILGDSAGAARAIDLLGVAAVAAGDHERAARLFGAAQGIWHTVADTIGSEPFRDRRERARSLARDELGAAEFDAVCAAGSELSVEDAVGYALGDTQNPDVPAESGPPPNALTARELEVAELIAEGLSNKQIAVRIVVARRTAESHVENILRKLDFSSRAQIAAWYADRVRTGR
jgi:non-specific serine/threonine protein kinase